MLAQIRRWSQAEISHIWRLGILYVATSMAFVQGASLISQFVLARFLLPEDFAIVKILENLLHFLVIPATAGIPTAVVTLVASSRNERDQRRLLGQGVALVAVGSALLSLLTTLAIPVIFKEPTAKQYAYVLVWVVGFTAVGRTVIAFYQGRKQIRQVAMYNAGLAVVSLVCTIGGGVWWGLKGWLVGRFVGEVLAVLGILAPVRRLLEFVLDKPRLVHMATFGGLAFVSLLLDRVVQMSDVVLLSRSGVSAMEVGAYGLAASLIAALTLPTAAIMTAAFPIVAGQPSVRASLRVSGRLLWRVALLTLGVCATMYWVMPVVVKFMWGKAYALTAGSFRMLLGWFFLNSLLTVIGTFFFGIRKPEYSVIGNSAGAGVYFGLSAWLIPKYGIAGMAGLLTLTSLVRSGVFGVLAWRSTYD